MIVIGQWLNSLAVLASDNRHNDYAWRIPIITQMIPPALLLLGLPFLAESPSWLIIKGRHEEAAKSFRKFNGPHFDVDAAMVVATAAVAQELELERAGSSWIQCFKGSDGRRTLIIVMVSYDRSLLRENVSQRY